MCRIDADENLADSEYEDEDELSAETKTEPATRISWLLQIALESLGVAVSSYIVSDSVECVYFSPFYLQKFLIKRNVVNFISANQSICGIGSSSASKPANHSNNGTSLHVD